MLKERILSLSKKDICFCGPRVLFDFVMRAELEQYDILDQEGHLVLEQEKISSWIRGKILPLIKNTNLGQE